MLSTNSSDTDTIQSLQSDTTPNVRLIIHHQFLGTKLASPVYIGYGVTCSLSPEQKVDVGSTMQASFNIDPSQEESIGILIYKLQMEDFDSSDEEIISEEEETTCTQLVMIWKAHISGEFYVDSFLIEHDRNHFWDRDGLMKLVKYRRLFNVQHGPVESTWSLHDDTVLVINLNVTHEEECRILEMTTYEGSTDNEDSQRPWHVDVDR
jgi:hypothetical protein